MTNNNFKNLILLEFMICKVEYFEGQSKLDKKFLDCLGETKVKISFKGCFILEIEEDGRCRSTVDDNGKRTLLMKSGKSCLLSMDQVACGSDYTAALTVSRKMPPGETGYFAFGVAKIDLKKIINHVKKPTCSKNQRVKSMQEVCSIKDSQGKISGQIDLFVRATSLGKHVVTMFQLGTSDSYYFKGTDKADSEENSDDWCPAFNDSGHLQGRNGRCSFKGDLHPSDTYQMGVEATPQQPYCTCPFSGHPQPKYQMAMRPWSVQAPTPPCANNQVRSPISTCPVSQQTPDPCNTYRDEDYEKLDGDYKEISAEVNGYEVKIKLLRRPKKCSTEH